MAIMRRDMRQVVIVSYSDLEVLIVNICIKSTTNKVTGSFIFSWCIENKISDNSDFPVWIESLEAIISLIRFSIFALSFSKPLLIASYMPLSFSLKYRIYYPKHSVNIKRVAERAGVAGRARLVDRPPRERRYDHLAHESQGRDARLLDGIDDPSVVSAWRVLKDDPEWQALPPDLPGSSCFLR